jgi:Tol biopolymer transport system component
VYQSNEAGDRFEIYVQAFPGSARFRKDVSHKGGTNPQWRRKDGREIYFLSSDNYVMVAAVTPSADGRNIEIGTPERLFPQPVGAQFEASSDGERFLLSAPLEDSFPPILIRTNWASALNADGPPSARSPQPAPAPPALINSNVVGPNPAAGAGVQSTAPLRQITIFDKDGKPLGTVGSPGAMEALAISPDATQVAFSRGANLFVLDTRTDTTSTVTYSYVANTGFGFSPDSKSIAYVSTQDGSRALYSKFANGTGFREKLYSPALSFSNWSMDLLMLSSVNRQLALSINGDRNNPVPLVVADGNTTFRLSPDTRLLAYVSDEDGSFQVWVRPFNPSSTTQPKGAVKISTNGVTGMIRWRADGQELYYLSKDAKVIAVPITTSPEIKVGQSRELFRAPLGQPGDVSADGQRFVFLTNAPTDTPRR